MKYVEARAFFFIIATSISDSAWLSAMRAGLRE
jgi:hypothetical protein